MRGPTEQDLTEAVLARVGNAADPRFKEVMAGLIRHLHDFVREVELTEDEWFECIKFLTATPGHPPRCAAFRRIRRRITS